MKKTPLFIEVWELMTKYRMATPSSNILIAFSGGPDSVALTSLLKEIQTNISPEIKLHLAHLNHLLRGEESQRDEMFAYDFARDFDLPLTTSQIDVAKLARGTNLEAKARELRYKFLQTTAQEIKADVVATAHNMNDQAETFLMRLIRGAGIKGLTGIMPVLNLNLDIENPDIKKIPIIRPLIKTKRNFIEKYIEEKQLKVCIDSSNFSTKFTRNKIRLKILPEVLEINPKAIEAISQTAEMLNQWQEILTIDQKPDQKKAIRGEIKIHLEEICNLAQVQRHQLLRDTIEKIQGKIQLTSKHIFSIDTLLNKGKSGKKIFLPQNLEIAREFDHIIIRQKKHLEEKFGAEDLESFELELNGSWKGKNFSIFYKNFDPKVANTNYVKGMFAIVDLDKVGEKLKIRFRLPGDKYIPLRHQSNEKLKTLMIEERIPLSERSLWPIVTTLEGEIIWAPKLALAAKFAANSKSSHFAIITAK
jgi:tRNA(Ile)-lysidine synthase